MGAVLAGPAGCLRSRWRSSPRKWRNDAVPRGRGQKAPSTRRCIKTCHSDAYQSCRPRQKAPSTTRRIKTNMTTTPSSVLVLVRKHPAPEGALRPDLRRILEEHGTRQKAPSTRRCIKTLARVALDNLPKLVRKHPAPEGALRHDGVVAGSV